MTESPSITPAQFKILSLDGGGIRGTFSSAVLASLEAQYGVSIRDYFDLITGTSTGGIIALSLAAGLPASEILEFYRTEGPKIFAPLSGPQRVWRLVASMARPKHSQAPLRESLGRVFGDRTMGSLRTRVVIPAFNANSGQIRLFKTPHHSRLTRDHTRSLVDVALATSAAPYFLPGLTTAKGERFIDGGVWANNPIAVGVIEAIGYLGIPATSIRVLSVGTTCVPFHVDSNVVRRGVLGLILGAVRGQSVGMFMASQMAGAHAQAKVLLGREEAILRIDQTVAPSRFAMDRVEDTQELIGLAEHVTTHAAPAIREHFLAERAAYPFGRSV